MAKPKKTPESQPPVDNDHVATGASPFSHETVAAAKAAVDAAEAADERPPQGITVRYVSTGTRADYHRFFFGRAGIPDVRRIDSTSLRGENVDPYLVDGAGHLMQVRCDHAAELLECSPTGGPSDWRLATDAEVAAYRGGA